jgi:hypothetical protein
VAVAGSTFSDAKKPVYNRNPSKAEPRSNGLGKGIQSDNPGVNVQVARYEAVQKGVSAALSPGIVVVVGGMVGGYRLSAGRNQERVGGRIPIRIFFDDEHIVLMAQGISPCGVEGKAGLTSDSDPSR